eukprot:351795-Chlamydomonas_euryale.AAC.1
MRTTGDSCVIGQRHQLHAAQKPGQQSARSKRGSGQAGVRQQPDNARPALGASETSLGCVTDQPWARHRSALGAADLHNHQHRLCHHRAPAYDGFCLQTMKARCGDEVSVHLVSLTTGLPVDMPSVEVQVGDGAIGRAMQRGSTWRALPSCR